MTVALDPPTTTPEPGTGKRSRLTVVGLVVALAAGGVLLIGGSPSQPALPAGRLTAAQF